MRNYTDDINHWLNQSAPGSELDENNLAALQRDDKTIMLLELEKESDMCHFYAHLLALEKNTTGSIIYKALTLNQFGRPLGGCWLSWDSEINMLCLRHSLNLINADQIIFNNTIQNFINSLDTARSLLTEEPSNSLLQANEERRNTHHELFS